MWHNFVYKYSELSLGFGCKQLGSSLNKFSQGPLLSMLGFGWTNECRYYDFASVDAMVVWVSQCVDVMVAEVNERRCFGFRGQSASI